MATPREVAEALRLMADDIEKLEGTVTYLVPAHYQVFPGTPARLVAGRRAVGGYWYKSFTDTAYELRREYGAGGDLSLWISRGNACERIQVGTKTEERPDPEALAAVPTVEVEVPVYEWKCSPLLEEV